MPLVNTAEGVNTVLVPAIRGGRHLTFVTDNDPGRLALSGYAIALGSVGVPLNAMIVAHVDLLDPEGRTHKATFLAVEKAEAPPRLAAHVAADLGGTAGPGQDIICLTATGAYFGGIVLALVNGGFRPANPAAN